MKSLNNTPLQTIHTAVLQLKPIQQMLNIVFPTYQLQPVINCVNFFMHAHFYLLLKHLIPERSYNK